MNQPGLYEQFQQKPLSANSPYKMNNSENGLWNSQTIFEEDTIEQLQLTSKQLVNKRQSIEFEEEFPSYKLQNQNLFGSNSTKKRQQENSNIIQLEDCFEKNLIEFLKENQSKQQGENFQKHDKSEKNPTNFLFDLFPLVYSYDHPNFDQSLRIELEKLVLTILSNVGKDNKKAIEIRNLYIHNSLLLQVYDALIQKYFSLRKVKEDMIRYILRKMLKTTRKSLNEAENLKGKKWSVHLCKRYLSNKFNLINNEELAENMEQELFQTLLPYSKKSKNRTMNTNFVQKIFSSEAFMKDYQEFLAKFKSYLQQDNKKKLDKLLDILIEYVKNYNFKRINDIKVFPWLDSWLEEIQKVAVELLQVKTSISQS